MSISAPGTTSRFGDWLRRLDPHGVWQSRLFNLTVAIIVGVILGQLLYKPNPRIIKATAGFGVLYAAWQTLRADDELWVADDPLRAPDA